MTSLKRAVRRRSDYTANSPRSQHSNSGLHSKWHVRSHWPKSRIEVRTPCEAPGPATPIMDVPGPRTESRTEISSPMGVRSSCEFPRIPHRQVRVRQKMHWQNSIYRISGADQITYIVFRGRTKLHIYRLAGRAKLHITCGARDFKKYFKKYFKKIKPRL